MGKDGILGSRALRLAACCILATGAVLFACACAGSSRAPVSEVAAVVNVAQGALPLQGVRNHHASQPSELDPASLLSVPGSTDIILFDVKAGTSAIASDASLDDVRDAVQSIEEAGSCGFMFVDAVMGCGLAYNAEDVMYIASAVKAPLVLYALQHDAGAGEDERVAIEETIVNSDNDAFESFAYTYTDAGFSQWLSTHGVIHEDYAYDLYPRMSARSLASFWIELLQYVQAGSDNALWLGDLLSWTETSFIRDALWDVDAAVMNKGGWINEDSFDNEMDDEAADEDEEHEAAPGEPADDEVVYRAVSDAGAITCDDHTYVMVILTTQPDGGATEANVSALARALFDVRGIL